MSSQIVAELSRVIAPENETISAMGSQQTNFHDAHFKKKLREMSFAALQVGVNFDDVGILGPDKISSACNQSSLLQLWPERAFTLLLQ